MSDRSNDIHETRRQAAQFVISWLEQNPTTRRLNAAASCCNWQIDEAEEIIRWILDQPACTAETVLFLLDRCGINRCDEEGLRFVDEIFRLCDEMIEGLRKHNFVWAAPPRTGDRDTAGIIAVKQWEDVTVLNYCDLYSRIEEEDIPEPVKDAFEILGCGFGERVAKVARQMLIDKGYDPDEL